MPIVPLSAILGQSSGGTQNLQDVTDNGNSTTNDIDLLDSRLIIIDENSVPVGRLTQGIDPDFGLVLIAETTEGLRDKRLTLAGSNILLGTEQLEAVFNGAEDGNFLQISGKTDVLGNDVFVVNSIPLNVNENEELFNSSLDVALSTSYQTCVNGVLTFDYRIGTSYGEAFIYIENSDSQEAEVEVGFAIGASTPPQTSTFTIPRKQGANPGSRRIDFRDTFTTDLNIGDDINVRIRLTSGTTVNVLGSTNQTLMTIIQTANLRNGIQTLVSRSTSTPISIGQAVQVDTPNTVYTLPQALLVYNEQRPIEIEVNNISTGQIIIDTSGADNIYRAGGATNLYGMSDGESAVFRCISTTQWKIVRSYINTRSLRTVVLGTSSTNANYSSSPQTLISFNHQFGFGLLKVTLSFEVSTDAVNRSTIVGLFIDGSLIDSESVIEPKDSRNNSYQTKVIDIPLDTSISHLFEVKYGRGNGGGGTLANVSNLRLYIEEMKLL